MVAEVADIGAQVVCQGVDGRVAVAVGAVAVRVVAGVVEGGAHLVVCRPAERAVRLSVQLLADVAAVNVPRPRGGHRQQKQHSDLPTGLVSVSRRRFVSVLNLMQKQRGEM